MNLNAEKNNSAQFASFFSPLGSSYNTQCTLTEEMKHGAVASDQELNYLLTCSFTNTVYTAATRCCVCCVNCGEARSQKVVQFLN